MSANVSGGEKMTAAAAKEDMLKNAAKLYPVPKGDSGLVRRQTMSEKNRGEGGFWVMYWWGLRGFELHVHYKPNGGILDSEVKVVPSGMRGSGPYLSSTELAQIRQYIRNPPL